MAPPSSSPHRSHLFTPIHEGYESEETDERHRFGSATPGSACKNSSKSRRPKYSSDAGDRSVSCTDCRPTNREKISMVVFPVDNHVSKHSLSSSSSPGIFKSLIGGISRRSPKPQPPLSESSPERDDQWRIAVAELSHKLVQTTRKKDEAILESSRLKYSMAELEKKLNRLEVYCHNLKSGLEICGFNHQGSPHFAQFRVDNHDLIIRNFLDLVSESRSSIRFLSKSLTSQIKVMGIKVFERLSTTLQSYDIKLSSSCSPRTLQFYLEALLNAAFFEDFESVGFERNYTTRILNPIERSESNYMDFNTLKDLAWEEVFSKGTKHFSEEFSRFCDRKMSEIVAILGWNRAWSEQLLQAFFGASKSVWLVHLLANSVHPTLTIFRVDKGVRFDLVYMEDTGGDKTKKLVPTMVRIMVAPGFNVYDNVVKSKVLCKYYNSDCRVFSSNGDDNRIALSPP